MAPRVTTILGLFGTHGEAERAVNMLAERSFPVDRLGFLAPAEVRERNQARAQAVGLGAGSAMGALAGGALGAIAASTLSGIGPVITGGALLPIIVGILTGGATGGTVGSLLAAAGSNDQIAYFVQEVRSGRALVGVQTGRVREAEDILLAAGALEAADVGGVDLPEPGSAPQERARGSIGAGRPA